MRWFCIIMLFIFSCGDEAEINALKRENRRMETKIESLEDKIEMMNLRTNELIRQKMYSK